MKENGKDMMQYKHMWHFSFFSPSSFKQLQNYMMCAKCKAGKEEKIGDGMEVLGKRDSCFCCVLGHNNNNEEVWDLCFSNFLTRY